MNKTFLAIQKKAKTLNSFAGQLRFTINPDGYVVLSGIYWTIFITDEVINVHPDSIHHRPLDLDLLQDDIEVLKDIQALWFGRAKDKVRPE